MLHERSSAPPDTGAYVVELARQAAEKGGSSRLGKDLASRVAKLEPSRLAKEDTLCRESKTQPYWPDNLMKRYIKPVAKKAGITKNIGWHTFRHSFGTLLKANGEDIKTVQAFAARK
jgi:integrase